MVATEKKRRKTLGLRDWVVFGIFAVIVGIFLFVEIATIINPNFFVREKSITEKTELIRNNNPPKKKLPDTLVLDKYELDRSSYFSSDYPSSLEEPDRFSRFVEGKLTNKGDLIPAWALHIQFDIYDLDGKIVDGAYCIIWNDSDIETGSTWNFGEGDNLDDCFPSVSNSRKIDVSKYVVVYRDYDMEL